jgi:hypothetical protein
VIRRATVILLALCACSACTESKSVRSEKHDRDSLAKVVEHDMHASQAMRDADEAATKGDAGAALDIISHRATPAVDEGLALLENTTVDTEWGKTKKSAVEGVLRDRKKEMPRYEDAVKSGDIEKMVGAMQAQAEIERRALGTVKSLEDAR